MLQRPPPPPPAARAARRRQQHAAAQRRHRRRERQGVIMATIAITPEQTAKLAKLDYLDDVELENRHAIARAIAELLDSIAVK